VTTSDTKHNTKTAVKTAFLSLRRHPGLAVIFAFATLVQGALQGGMVWALREVLITISRPRGVGSGVLVVGALAVFTVWLLRSAGVFASHMFSARLAHRVELDWMSRVLEKLVTLSVRFFDKSSRGDLAMAAYNDARSIRAVTLQLGRAADYRFRLCLRCRHSRH